MLAKAPLNDIEYGEGTMHFTRQEIASYSTCMRIHRGTKYALPSLTGNRWVGWIESYGEVSYDAESQSDAEQSCIRQIERFIRHKHSIFAQRAL